MDNRFDHIEDSLRNAFEGFEMPVTDMDWNAIEAGLQKPERRRGIIAWFKDSRKRRWGLLALLLAGSGAAYWLGSAQQSLPAAGKITAQEQPAPGKTPENVIADNGTGVEPNTKESGILRKEFSAAQAAERNNTKVAHNTNPVNNIYPPPKPAERGISIPADPEEGVSEGTTIHEPKPGFGSLKGASLRQWPVLLQNMMLGFLHNWKAAKGKNPDGGPKSGLECYAQAGLLYSPGKLNSSTPSGNWEGTQLLTTAIPAIHFRAEAGAGIQVKNIYLYSGIGADASAQTLAGTEYKVKIATRWIPYQNMQGDTLYHLAVQWKDSVVTIGNRSGNRQTQLWAEIPLGVRHTIRLNNQWDLNTGLQATFGVLASSNRQVANPYLGQPADYWQYKLGKQADYTSATLDASEFLRKFRAGTGVNLGIQYHLPKFDLGVQTTGLYYISQTWKNTPWNQRNIMYGLQLRAGFKF
ncbi:MAG: hypothetical protein JNL57_02285 [Bacteroidetes bacterium]|nr:hypothetical protein [Bacteroidota bacterium]